MSKRFRPPKGPIPNTIDTHLISRENWHLLIENVINDAQPVPHQACDWVGIIPKPQIYPLIVYRQIERLRNGNSSSREQTEG
jgi:hypothetical protein